MILRKNKTQNINIWQFFEASNYIRNPLQQKKKQNPEPSHCRKWWPYRCHFLYGERFLYFQHQNHRHMGCFEGLIAYSDSPLTPSRCKQVSTAKLLGFVGKCDSRQKQDAKHKHMAMFSRGQTIYAIPCAKSKQNPGPPHCPKWWPYHCHFL